MIPSAFVALDAFPETPNRKIDRNALPKPEYHSKEAAIAPSTDLERAIADLWTDVLDVDVDGVNRNFFELGGHSLLATRLIARLESDLHLTVPVRVAFDAPTVAAMATWVEDAAADEAELERIGRIAHLHLKVAAMSESEIQEMLASKRGSDAAGPRPPTISVSSTPLNDDR
jgi:acyl carrier protein